MRYGAVVLFLYPRIKMRRAVCISQTVVARCRPLLFQNPRQISIKIPTSYPFEPPKMKFITKVWHPNISSQTGAICLDILKDNWSPALTIKTALLSVQALLTAAEPDDPQVSRLVVQSHFIQYTTRLSLRSLIAALPLARLPGEHILSVYL